MKTEIPLSLSDKQIDTIFNALGQRPFLEVESTIVNLRTQVQKFFQEEKEKELDAAAKEAAKKQHKKDEKQMELKLEHPKQGKK